MINQNEIILDRYRMIRLLGSGGFGAVYLAEDQRLSRSVAIKEIDVARLAPDERVVAEQLFEREARMLAALDHPGLTRVWDYFEQNQRAFLVMEYVPGQTLRDLLHKQGGPLDEAFVLECALQLCAVLTYLHAQRPQVIFRDLKPANVMVVPGDGRWELADAASAPANPQLASSRFVLIDFGIARLFKPDQTGDTLIIGTPGYAPPEQYGQGQTDERSDIYSLGATLHQLLCDRVPNSVPPPPLTQVTPELARVIARATEVDPSQRYQHVAALQRDLLEITQLRRRTAHNAGWIAAPPAAPDRTPPAQPRMTTQLPLAPPRLSPRPRQTSPTLLLVLVLAVVGIVAVGGLAIGAFTRQPRPPSNQASGATATPDRTVAPAGDWLLPGAPGRIVFGQYSGDIAYNLALATLDGKPPQPLTSAGADYSGVVSPDGQKLAFARVTARDRQSAILAGNIDARDFQTVVTGDSYARYPAWSPDGKQLAFAIAPSRSGSFRLAVLDLATGQVRYPGPDRVGWLTWSTHGLTYAARRGANQAQDLFVLDSSGAARNLTNTADIEEEFPAWSPDGSRLAFVASPAGSDNLPLRQIFTSNADGSERTQLTENPGAHTNPVWSPDGKWIAYLYQAPGGKAFQIWAMHADGSAQRQLTSDAVDKFYLSWGE